MSKRDPQFTDELISAYLDGELSEAERARVEQVVESEPRYRQMLDELGALRDSLQALPRYQLNESFHQRVLHRALEQSQPERSSSRNGVMWRRIIWVAATLAAAVLVMLYGSQAPTRFWRGDQGELTRSNTEAPGLSRSAQSESQDEMALHDAAEDAPVTGNPAGDRIRTTEELSADPKGGMAGGGIASDAAKPDRDRDEARFAGDVEFAREAGQRPTLADLDAEQLRQGNREAMSDAVTERRVSGAEPDVDAVVYFIRGQPVDPLVDATAGRRKSQVGAEPPDLPYLSQLAKRSNALPHDPMRFFVVTGSPEQIATSARQLEPAPRTRSGFGLSRGRPDGSFARQPAQNLHRYHSGTEAEPLLENVRKSDLYIDLDLADSQAAQVQVVESNSDQHQVFLKMLMKEEGRGRGLATEDDGVPSRRPGPLAERADSVRDDPRATAESKGLVRSADQSALANGQVSDYVLIVEEGGKSAPEPASVKHGRTAEPADFEMRTLAEKLRGIQAADQQSQLRVLFVLPDAALAKSVQTVAPAASAPASQDQKPVPTSAAAQPDASPSEAAPRPPQQD